MINYFKDNSNSIDLILMITTPSSNNFRINNTTHLLTIILVILAKGNSHIKIIPRMIKIDTCNIHLSITMIHILITTMIPIKICTSKITSRIKTTLCNKAREDINNHSNGREEMILAELCHMKTSSETVITRINNGIQMTIRHNTIIKNRYSIEVLEWTTILKAHHITILLMVDSLIHAAPLPHLHLKTHNIE